MANVSFDYSDPNPFSSAVGPEAPNPFARGRVIREKLAVADDAAADTYTYTMVKSGPDVDPAEVELAGVSAVEVMVLWDATVLHVDHLSPPRDFFVGEQSAANAPCDFLLPAEVIGTGRAPVVLAEGETVSIVIPPGATGSLELAGQSRTPLEAAAETAEPYAGLNGARKVRLAGGSKAKIQLGQFVFQIATVDAGRPAKKGIGAGFDWSAASYFGLTLLASATMVGAMAFFVPPMGLTGDEDPDKDQIRYIQQLLSVSAETDLEERDTPTEGTANSDSKGGTGQRAAGEEGQMGKETSRQKNKKYSIEGDDPDPRIAKRLAFNDFVDNSMIGLLNQVAAGDPNSPTALWGANVASGADRESYLGGMWGDDFGDSYGKNGLGLSGIGESGGGRGEGIGLGNVRTYGHGAGLGLRDGFGNHHGRLAKGHVTKSPSVRPEGVTSLTGRLPPETIQRIVRNNYGSFRFCYQKGLERNPNLEGRVVVRFTINRDGAVGTSANGGSSLADSTVVGCVVRSFYRLSFPAPEGGIVSVVYPIAFSPGG